MRLTKDQIEKMYLATQENGADEYYVEKKDGGQLAFGAVQLVEKRKSIALGKVKP